MIIYQSATLHWVFSSFSKLQNLNKLCVCVWQSAKAPMQQQDNRADYDDKEEEDIHPLQPENPFTCFRHSIF